MKKSQNLLIRTLTGTILIALVVGATIWSSYSFALLFGLIATLSIGEFQDLVHKKYDVSVKKITGILSTILLFITAYLHAAQHYGIRIYAFYILFFICSIWIELFRKTKNPIHNLAYFTLGQVYIAFPFAILNYIYFIDSTNPIIPLTMFISLWVNDSGAYIAGSLLGKHKFFERISPKKTWEGFIGGAIFSVLTAYLFSHLIPQVSFLEWLVYTEIVVLFGTFGDLTESMLKRTVDAKDSGKLMPGHGGLLDRFDSMLLLSPIVWMYLNLILS